MSTAEISKETFAAFAGKKMIAAGDLFEVAEIAKSVIDGGELEFIHIFNDADAQPVEIDFRGSTQDVIGRLEKQQKLAQASSSNVTSSIKDDEQARGPGRPKLGVVAREITLMPRHWEWLNSQPGGASVALRKLVDEARHANAGKDSVRQSQEKAYRFMSAMAGNLPGFEEASRALFSGDEQKFLEHTSSWPLDISKYSLKLASQALQKRSN